MTYDLPCISFIIIKTRPLSQDGTLHIRKIKFIIKDLPRTLSQHIMSYILKLHNSSNIKNILEMTYIFAPKHAFEYIIRFL